jgi:putative transposase
VKKRFRYRAYLTREQQQAAARVFGCARVIWNDALRIRGAARENGENFPSTVALSKSLITDAKKTPEREWLSDAPVGVLQNSLRDQQVAWTRFFDTAKQRKSGSKLRHVGPPRFRKKTSRQTARFTLSDRFQIAGGWVNTRNRAGGRLRLPKIGKIKVAWSRDLPSAPSSVTLILESTGHYYVSFVVDIPDEGVIEPAGINGRMAGIDLGLKDFASIVYTDGTRERIENPRFYRAGQRKLARAQRKLSRAQRGSKNRAKAKLAVARTHARTAQKRAAFHLSLAQRLGAENQGICIETLNIRGMGRTRLAKSVHDAGWGSFVTLLGTAAAQYGHVVHRIDQWAPTTKTCAVCGCVGESKALSVREWTCLDCGASLDRDYNAAVNIIVAAGLAETLNACGGDVRLRLAGAVPVEAGTHRTAPEALACAA